LNLRRLDLRKAQAARLNTIRDINRQIVSNYVREREPISRAEIARLVSENFDLRPGAFRKALDLHRPIYQQTAAYGHFGRELDDFTWERTDRADTLRDAAGLAAGAVA